MIKKRLVCTFLLLAVILSFASVSVYASNYQNKYFYDVNRVASVILNEYVQAARAAQIELEMDVQVPEVLFVTAADLYVLIGNTMDNAIVA